MLKKSFHDIKCCIGQYGPSVAAIVFAGLMCLNIMTACSISNTSQSIAATTKPATSKTTASNGTDSTESTAAASSRVTGDSAGLNSIEAPQLVWPKAKANFGDAVLFRMAPNDGKDSTELRLAGDWQETGRSTEWFIWYADVDGENWLMFEIKGKELGNLDIGTRSFSVMAMGDDWPREQPAIAIEDAARTATAQGANMDALTWVELACDYPAGDFRTHPYWIFACSETTDSGLTLNYRLLVDAITGEAAGALNDRDEALALPIDLASLDKPRAESHEADLRAFFDLVITQDWTFSMFQLSYNMAPDDATRQMWLSNFQSLDSLEVVSIEPASLVQWSDEWESYKVVLQIETKEPVDKYGWENGENTRWISIIPQGAGNWKIESFSSSP